MKRARKKAGLFDESSGPVVSAAEIEAYSKVPIEKRLEWLDETRRFFFETLTPETKKCWETLRKSGF